MKAVVLGLGLLGCAGADGADGERGKAGESAVASVREATEGECPAGGSVLEIGVGDELEETVICNGEDGADGEQGPQGERGPKGDAGAAATAGIGRIEATLYCGAILEGTAYLFGYWAAEFTDGSLWVSAQIANGSVSASGSQFYAQGQTGALTASVQLSLDSAAPANHGFWTIGFERTIEQVSVIYTDSDLAEGGMSWSLDSNSANCVRNAVPAAEP